MTQPTFKLATKPDKGQGALAPIKLASIGSSSAHDYSVNYNSQDKTAMTLDKAALLALFVIPSDTPASNEPLSDNHSDTDNSDTNSFDTNSSDVNKSEASVDANSQRVALYRAQHERTRLLYLASASSRPTYLVQTLKPQFIEYQHYLLAEQLDKRGLLDTDAIERLWQQLHVVDDIIADIVRLMPAQQPAGWQLTTQEGHNPLCLATIGKLKHPKPVQDQASLNSYVLAHFGVSSFSYDRSYYIGHVIGYLFSCYYCAHLSISYGITALGTHVVQGYDYASLETPYMVRLLQGLDGYCKKRVYQLAVICARLSVYATDKRIEKMLIAEVNDFDKKLQQQHLDMLLLQGLMPDSNDSTPLF